jgi:hypothetical protein
MKLEEGEEIVTTTRIRKKRPRRKKDPIDELLRIGAAIFILWLIYALGTGQVRF